MRISLMTVLFSLLYAPFQAEGRNNDIYDLQGYVFSPERDMLVVGIPVNEPYQPLYTFRIPYIITPIFI